MVPRKLPSVTHSRISHPLASFFAERTFCLTMRLALADARFTFHALLIPLLKHRKLQLLSHLVTFGRDVDLCGDGCCVALIL